jgi:hypothetical protein
MTAHANSHTHCQVAQADPQAKTWQRVRLFQRTTDRQSGRKKNTERTTAVWRNGGFSASYDSFVGKQTLVLRINICGKIPPPTPSRKPLPARLKPKLQNEIWKE